MKARVKQLWVEALRSGDFQQGRNWLRRGNRCCCLGVLCELAYEAGVIDAPQEDLEAGAFVYGKRKAYYAPPPQVLRWAGLRSGLLDVFYLAELNDEGASFQRIAAVIEQEF